MEVENQRSPLKEIINSPNTRSGKKPRLDADTTAVLRFAKLTQNATTPTKGSKLAAGFDLYSAYDYTVPAHGKRLAKTDIQIAVPDGCYGRIAPRSGLAHKHFIDVGAGVIDEDYRGNVGIILFNFADQEFEVKKGDRIAQLICERILLPKLEELEVQLSCNGLFVCVKTNIAIRKIKIRQLLIKFLRTIAIK